ncbi:MAG TPA: hypothetical protein VFI42_01720 [Thermomicrobiaceae bacterium]|nr:hypothetical protein [Thermomicrobiaceae bacterium]
MVLFIVLILAVFGVLSWLISRSRRKLLVVKEPPVTARQAQQEEYGDDTVG